MFNIYLFLLYIISIIFAFIWNADGLADTCNVNGVIYNGGQQWTTMPDTRLLRCTCHGNGRGQWNCEYTDEDAFLIAADSSKIAKVALGGHTGFRQKFIEQLQGTTIASDVDVEGDYVYWTDVSFKSRGIYRAKYSDGSQIVRIVSNDIYEPNGLSVDWLAKNIYWTDAQLGAIFVAREDGKHRTMVLGGLSEPRSLIVLPLHGIMFWSDQFDGAIYSAKMDGSDKKTVIAGLVWPNEITVDTQRNTIYWVDGYRRTIESCTFDGYFYKLVFNYTLMFSNPAFGLSLFNDRLFFSIWNEKALFSITTLGQDIQKVLSGMSTMPSGVTVVNNEMQKAPASLAIGPCRSHRKSCSHICLPTSRTAYTCSCPDGSGLVLSRDRRNCITPDEFLLFTSLDDGSIMMMSQQLGAPRKPVLLTRSDQPSAIEYDPVEKRIYWSDVGRNAIFRMFLNSTKKEIFLENGVGIVDGLAIDWVNRHLYFTNYGWGASQTQYHRIEIINLNRKERKIIAFSELEKPRDLVIDQERGFLYYSDWGTNARVVRLDLDGRNPHILPIHVENPNGLALYNGILYITDSHHKSALMQINGTVVFGNPPTLTKYDTVLRKSVELTDLEMEVPFGASMKKGTLYVTDWGLGTISEYDVNNGDTTIAATGLKKPTGIVYASLNSNKMIVTECMISNPCSHTCVNVDMDHYSCMCPDNAGLALSDNKINCVAPDQFILVADVDKILMKSESPKDSVPYAVVQTFDDYSNIVALAYDPITSYIYWADNGRQRISRRPIGAAMTGAVGGEDNIELVYSNIEHVEGMAIDPENKLLFWTDSELGTIELFHLTLNYHTTILENLQRPRAIALDTNMGVMYWSEHGMRPTVQTSLMNGQDMRTFLNQGLKWPNGLMFDTEDEKVYVADGAVKKIQILSAIGGDTLGGMDLNNTVDHIFGVGKMGRAIYYTDWYNGALMSTDSYETKTLIRNMSRPSQIYAHSTFMPTSLSPCTTAVHECSHICIPSPGSYVCLCPDHLILAADQRSCVRPEHAHLYTTTLEPPTTAAEELTTFGWAEEFTTAYPEEEEEDHTLRVELIVQTTVQPNITNETTTTPVFENVPTTIELTTVPITTVPPPPEFKTCPSEEIVMNLPQFTQYVEISVESLGVEAFDSSGKKLNPFIADKTQMKLLIGEHSVKVVASDDLIRIINCTVNIKVQDTTPPAILYCPPHLEIESYAFDDTAYVTWETPKFADNSGADVQIFNSHNPGHYPDGLHNITYKAVDRSGNTAVCSFLVAVLHITAECGDPWEPPRSYLTCHTDQEKEEKVCQISCEKEYRLTLESPYIKCKMASGKASPSWQPYLDENVCKKPTIGNPQQEISLQFPCPCENSTSFYEFTLAIFTAQLKEESNCDDREHKLGFCMNSEQKLRLNCVNTAQLNVTIMVDLAKLDGIRSTMEAKRIVRRSSTEILDMAISGRIQTRGSDFKDYMANSEAMALSDINILCMSGSKAVDEGCVTCPKGTFWKDNDCHFCPLHTYQPFASSMTCFPCEEGLGTETVGAANEHLCVSLVSKEPISSSNTTYIIVGATVAGVILLIIFLVLLGLWHRRKKRREMKKALRRKKMEAKRRRQRRNSDGSMRRRGSRSRSGRSRSIESSAVLDSRTSSKRSSGSKRVTISENNIEHKIPHRDDLKDMDAKLAAWKKAVTQKHVVTDIPNGVNKSKNEAIVTDDAQSEITESVVASENTFAASETTNGTLKSESKPGSVTSDLGDETLSCASSRTTTPIKGVLKKPRQRVMSLDDNLSVTSGATTVEPMPPQQQRRGRNPVRRNASQKLPDGSQRLHIPAGRLRSSSLDREPMSNPQKNYDIRFLTLGPQRGQNMAPIQKPSPQTLPPPPDYHSVIGGPPRMMVRAPPRGVMYRHPNQRMPFIPPGGRPVRPQPRMRMQRAPYNSGYWNNGYDTNSDWDSMSVMSTDTDMRPNPHHMGPPARMMSARYPRPMYAPRGPGPMPPFPQRPRRY